MKVALGLGSNLGDREAHLLSAIEGLARHATVVAVSSFQETEPVGGPPQGPYLNAAVIVETPLDPDGLLQLARTLEADAGRVREQRWGPRTLDVDLLLCEDRIIERPGLSVPHPRLSERRFVLQPLAEIAPEWVVPGSGRSVEALLEDLQEH